MLHCPADKVDEGSLGPNIAASVRLTSAGKNVAPTATGCFALEWCPFGRLWKGKRKTHFHIKGPHMFKSDVRRNPNYLSSPRGQGKLSESPGLRGTVLREFAPKSIPSEPNNLQHSARTSGKIPSELMVARRKFNLASSERRPVLLSGSHFFGSIFCAKATCPNMRHQKLRQSAKATCSP